MLDLGSLLVSMGLQSEMKNVRIEEAQVFGENQTEESNNAAVEAVDSALQSVDTAASALAGALTPPAGPVAAVLDSCVTQAPSVDLSLPTVPVSKK